MIEKLTKQKVALEAMQKGEVPPPPQPVPVPIPEPVVKIVEVRNTLFYTDALCGVTNRIRFMVTATYKLGNPCVVHFLKINTVHVLYGLFTSTMILNSVVM